VVPSCGEIAEGQRFSVVRDIFCRRLPVSVWRMILNHVAVTDPSQHSSLQPCCAIDATVKQGEDKWVLGPDALQVAI
jgi:hypothetical protein